MTATVEYRVGTYHGIVDVKCLPNDEDEHIIARTKRMLENDTSLPSGYESWKVIDRSED